MKRVVACFFTGLVLAAPIAAAPEPAAWNNPITISQGGTYSGSWESTSPTEPAVHITTAEPVVIQDSRIRNLAGGGLVATHWPLAANVTIRRVQAFGGIGRFFEAEGFKSVVIANNTIDKTSGIRLATPVAGASVRIARNRHRNIQRGSDHFGQFVQLAEVHSARVEVAWNEILNQYNRSEPEDIVSIYKSAHVRLHDNYLEHQSTPGNAYNTSSQNPITIETGEGNPPASLDNEVWNNQIVDCVGGVAIVGNSHGNVVHHNRVVQDGYLPDGVTRMGNGWLAMFIGAGTTNNRMRNNTVGFVNRDGRRNNFSFPGAPGDHALNTPIRGKVTRAAERAEWKKWLAKLRTSKVRVGA